MESLRYPIGRFERVQNVTAEQRQQWIAEITALPAQVRAAVAGLTDEQLDTPYRPEGWTVRQVVHHLPDSHLNSYIRFRWTLTEDTPLIKTYDEKGWATLPDAASGPIALSLDLLTALHARWTALLTAMSPADFDRAFRHPEWHEITLGETLGLYAWHGLHHVAHITTLRERMEW